MAKRGKSAPGFESQLEVHFDMELMKPGKQFYQAYETCVNLSEPDFAKQRMKLHKRAVQKLIKIQRHRLSEMMLGWVDTKDFKKFLEFAKALETVSKSGPIDRYRTKILELKEVYDLINVKCGVREVALMIGWHGNDEGEGFPQLRRLCKDLKFPLGPTRQTKRKK